MLFLLIPAGSIRAQARPNILLLVSDDQRPDTIAALGNPLIKTPSLDRLVREGTSFTRAICANPICTPSRAELLTGSSGLRNGVVDFGGTIRPHLPTLPEPFAEAGYRTYYSGKWHNDGQPSQHGYAATRGLFTGGGQRWWKPKTDYRGHEVSGYRGWLFRDPDNRPRPELGVGLTATISERFADAAIAVIQHQSQQPFFLHVNFTAPHDPLLIPPGYETAYQAEAIPLPRNFVPEHPFDHGNEGGRDERLLPLPRTAEIVRADLAAYYAVISHLDEQIGRILNALDQSGKTSQTLIVFCSDHGLAMGSHGLRGKQNMYEHTIGVPLIFAGPQIPNNRRVVGQAYLRDIFPTLCDLVGLPIPDVDGVSQLPVIRGDRESIYPHVIGYFRDRQRMIRTDRWKYIEYPKIDRQQLFDLRADPDECHDLSAVANYREVVEPLRRSLHQEIERLTPAGDH